jgi:lipid II:glycine glycyltransferase (peptidoglycan interpeptide bridge formation enzyme)
MTSLPAEPAVAADPAAASIEPLAAWARRNGALSLNLGSLEGGGRRWGGQVDDGEERIEFVVSPADRSELLRRMRTMARRGARRAERHGVVIERGLEGDTPVFARLFESTIARLKRDKDIHVGRFDKQRFASNLAMLITSQHGRLYLARLEDDYVGGCFFGVAGTSAYYLYNGSTESALRVGATPLTLLQAMTDFSEEAFTRINLGGVPASARQETSPDHGLYEFKLGLGTEPVECHGGRVRLRPVRLKLLDVASSLRARTQ